MRVVAGTAGGRRLVAPAGRDVRPTSDRVREAVFSMVASRRAIAGTAVLDLFAGSGALGIEALSRGAASATFVERDPAALRAIRTNLAACGLAAGAEVVRDDAVRFLGRAADHDAGHDDAARYDIAFCDPPYAFRGWPELLGRLRADLVVVESDHEVETGPDWRVLRLRRHGGTVVALLVRADADDSGPPAER